MRWQMVTLGLLISLMVALSGAAAIAGVSVLPAPTAGQAGLVTLQSTGTVVSQLSMSYNHACVVTSTGGLKRWGANSYRQVGDGTTTGAAKCWGYKHQRRAGQRLDDQQ